MKKIDRKTALMAAFNFLHLVEATRSRPEELGGSFCLNDLFALALAYAEFSEPPAVSFATVCHHLATVRDVSFDVTRKRTFKVAV